MENNHEHEGNRIVLFRVLVSIILFVLGFVFKPLFFAAYFISGYDIILLAAKNLLKREIFDENFLMSVATIGALCIQEYPEAAMVMILYQFGEFLQDKAIHKSKKSIQKLINIRPEYAVVNDRKINPENVEIGEIVTVKPGEKIPLDGIVVEGSALIDNSALTGESMPVFINEGKNIISGGINLNGILKIKVTNRYKESTVHKIIELIETSAEKKAKTEKFITRFARIYTPVVVFFALAITICLPNFTDICFHSSLERALTFLVISCPCALVISIPLTFFAGIGYASKNGILIKGGNYLEQLAKTKTVVFDKTGTLTTGVFGIRGINSSNPDILKYAAIAEKNSPHPIAKALRQAYNKDIPDAMSIRDIAGHGTEVEYEGKRIKIGTASFIGTNPINTMGTVVYISIDNVYEGNIVLADVIKNDSAETIGILHKLGIRTVIFTGDTKERAETLMGIIGISEAYSELLPADKVNKLEEVMKQNRPVVFAGDGINDAPVLKRSDVGIAMGGIGSDAAIEASDIVIMDDKPAKIVTAIKIARKTMNIAKQNIAIALGIKTLFLVLGGFGLMTMWGAVFADVGVALIAILNSLRAKN